jgi:hypothetical protein
MGSGAETAHETVDHLLARGEKVGVLKVRLYRPFSPSALIAALPAATTAVAVLDRCKEPGADGEPLYKDVVTALAQAAADGARSMPRVIGGRYGLASKEFTPGMVKAVFDELARAAPKRVFTVGIHDDLTHLSLAWDADFRTDASQQLQHAVFWGLGADGTVSANKNSIKILGEATALMAQGYFVYDSKKSGAVTVSHLRFGPAAIRSTYLVEARHGRLRRLPPADVRRSLRFAGARRARRRLPAQHRGKSRSGLGHAAAEAACADRRKAPQAVGDRRLRRRRRSRHGAAHQHHHADLLLRHFRHPAEGRGDRRDQGTRSTRPTARRASGWWN